MPEAHPKDQKITLSHLAKHFSDEAAAWQLMERLRWPDGPICPHCKATKAYFLQPRTPDRYTRTGHATQRRVWKCAECRKQFSVLVGTIFEDSRIPLSKWLLAIHLLCAAKNGVSSTELARTLEITQKSAWFMAHRIRYAMQRPPLVEKLRGIVEADETYVGGKPRKAPGRTKREAALLRMDNKTPVVTLVERGGEVRSQVMPRVTGENIAKLLRENVEPSAQLMTDSSKLYVRVGREFPDHQAVDHGAGEYARGDVHVNAAEGYFGQLKRSIDGTHHHVSAQHLHRYVSEFDHRYNTRKLSDGDRTVLTVKKAEGKRLRYRQPVEKE